MISRVIAGLLVAVRRRMRPEHRLWLAEADRVEREAAAGKMVLIEHEWLVSPSTAVVYAAALREMANQTPPKAKETRHVDPRSW